MSVMTSAQKPRSWQDEALCAVIGTDPEIWHPENRQSPTVKTAKRICGECDVRADCLQYAIERPYLTGIWGGTDDQDRRDIRKRTSRERRVQAMFHG